MSWHKFHVYGEGFLATTMRCALEAHRLELADDADLAFVAQDVLDHSSAEQLNKVRDLLMQAVLLHPVIVVLSQVPPRWMGAWNNDLHPAHVFYQIDTLIVKRAVERATRPEQVVIGCADPSAILPLAYQEYLAPLECPVLQMSYESAELAKCAINYFLGAQIKATNELWAAAEQLGASWDDVVRVLRNDVRIGKHAYLDPGLPNRHLLRDIESVEALIARKE